jgi:hypothetical protein
MESKKEESKKEESIACKVCNKHSIYNLKCRCENFFCKKHFEISKHNCSWDYCGESNKQLCENLQKIETKKIESF